MKGESSFLEKQNRPTASVFDKFSEYWSELSDANSTKKQVDMAKRNLKSTGSILDLGCGNGRHMLSLRKAGYDVNGVDISKSLLTIAERRLIQGRVDAPLVEADFRFLPFRSGAFSSVLSLDTSFGYMPSEEEDLGTLREVNRVLSEGGVLLIDVFNRERIMKRHRSSANVGLTRVSFRLLQTFPKLSGLFKWREYPDFLFLAKRNVTPDGNLLRDLWVFQEKKTGKITVVEHVVRLYSLPQLNKFIEKMGFGVFAVFGDYDQNRHTENSSRLIIVALKTQFSSFNEKEAI